MTKKSKIGGAESSSRESSSDEDIDAVKNPDIIHSETTEEEAAEDRERSQ